MIDPVIHGANGFGLISMEAANIDADEPLAVRFPLHYFLALAHFYLGDDPYEYDYKKVSNTPVIVSQLQPSGPETRGRRDHVCTAFSYVSFDSLIFEAEIV